MSDSWPFLLCSVYGLGVKVWVQGSAIPTMGEGHAVTCYSACLALKLVEVTNHGGGGVLQGNPTIWESLY